jgi:hypothetical protein
VPAIKAIPTTKKQNPKRNIMMESSRIKVISAMRTPGNQGSIKLTIPMKTKNRAMIILMNEYRTFAILKFIGVLFLNTRCFCSWSC